MFAAWTTIISTSTFPVRSASGTPARYASSSSSEPSGLAAATAAYSVVGTPAGRLPQSAIAGRTPGPVPGGGCRH